MAVMGCSGAKPAQQGQLGLNVQDSQSVRSTIEAGRLETCLSKAVGWQLTAVKACGKDLNSSDSREVPALGGEDCVTG